MVHVGLVYSLLQICQFRWFVEFIFLHSVEMWLIAWWIGVDGASYSIIPAQVIHTLPFSTFSSMARFLFARKSGSITTRRFSLLKLFWLLARLLLESNSLKDVLQESLGVIYSKLVVGRWKAFKKHEKTTAEKRPGDRQWFVTINSSTIANRGRTQISFACVDKRNSAEWKTFIVVISTFHSNRLALNSVALIILVIFSTFFRAFASFFPLSLSYQFFIVFCFFSR